MSKKVIIDYDTLYNMYVEQLLPITKISELLNISYVTVKRNILEYNLIRDEVKFKENWNYKVSLTKSKPEFIDKFEKSNLEKYGVKNTLLLPENRLKWYKNRIDNKENIYNKVKNTVLDRYGVDNVFKSDIIKNKIKDYNLDHYGVEFYTQTNEYKTKVEQTCLDRYGKVHYNNIEKQKETVYNKYGVSNTSFIPSVIEKKALKQNESNKKGFETKRANNTFNTSNPEIEFYKFLIEDLKLNVSKEYICDRYPFHCDFYLNDFDIFIELNLFWTHGPHPFNSDNKEDLAILKLWEEKAVNSNFFKSAINVWTVKDVLKIKTAKNNNLKYFIVYNIDDINNLKNYLISLV